MAKASKGRAGRRAPATVAAPVAAAAAPRLVGDEGLPPNMGEQGEDHPYNPTNEPGEAEPAAGADNNKRLAFLEAQHLSLARALDGLDGYKPVEGEDVADGAIRIVANQAETIAALLVGEKDLTAEIEKLADLVKQAQDYAVEFIVILNERDDFAPEEGESASTSLKRLLAQLDGEIAALTADPAKAAQIEARKAHAKAEKGEVAVLADLPETASLTLRFAEDGDRFIATIPPIEIGRHELSAFGGRGVLERTIDFLPDLAPALIRSAWLIAGPKSVKCELHPGLRVGGGAVAKLPKGHLIF